MDAAGVSSRRPSSDVYGCVVPASGLSSSLLEPSAHDVMALEMGHQLGGGYLDPRSFGGSSFDEFQGESSPSFDIGSSSGYDHQPPPPRQFAVHTSTSLHSKYDSHGGFHQQQQMQRSVVYPVKTANPATCTQYAPVRTVISMKPQPRRPTGGRAAPKKEPLDPKRVEDEVARNVSQILSATKQHKLQQEAQQRCGIMPQISRISYSCPDCGKSMTSQRNLQRHRQASCSKKMESPSELSGENSVDGGLPGMDTFSHGIGTFDMTAETSDWCSSQEAFSQPLSRGRLDSNEHLGSLESSSLSGTLDCLAHHDSADDSRTHSSSASHCSSQSNNTLNGIFTCDSCKKTVCSLRSLKRHHTTCKQYAVEYGAPPESEVRPRSTSSSLAPPLFMPISPSSTTTCSEDSYGSSATSDDFPLRPRQPKIAGTHNTCLDCNRQLCSASNLKRHRATCKVVIQKDSVKPSYSTTRMSSVVSPQPVVSRSNSFPPIEIPARDRSIIDRSYAAALAASEQARQRQSTSYVMQEPALRDPILQQKPWLQITVGEHLRAQHVQKKMMEAQMTSSDEKTSPEDDEMDEKPYANSDDFELDPSDDSASDELGALDDIDLDAFDEEMLLREEEQQRQDQEDEDNIKKEVEEEEKQRERVEVERRSDTQRKAKEVKQEPEHSPSKSSMMSPALTPLDSIITTTPLNSDRLNMSSDRRIPLNRPAPANPEFQCPECKKTYSCRKNVKRHRMAVHKLSPDDVARYPGPAPFAVAAQSTVSSMSPSLTRQTNVDKIDVKTDYKPDTIPLPPLPTPPPQIRYQTKQINEGWRGSRDADDEESTETARIAAELKRSAELVEVEGKKPRAELAEADTTFNEDGESASTQSLHSSPGSSAGQPVSSSLVGSRTANLPSIGSWVNAKSLSVEIPPLSSRSANSSPAFRRRPQHTCDRCNRVLSSDYSLRRHRQNCTEPTANSVRHSPLLAENNMNGPLTSDPMLGHGASSTTRSFEDDWFKREEQPDSTTNQSRQDRASSPGVLMEQPEAPPLGALPYTRKRALSGGNSGYSNDPKQARHLCQQCGKFYSSEWNLERHRRESCPTKPGESSPSGSSDDVSVLLGSTRFMLSRSALSRASASFVQLFNMHDPAKVALQGELRLDFDAGEFQSLLDVYNNPAALNPENVDCVARLADKLKFNSVFECCTKYITEELPRISVMHAIFLAEHYKLATVKQKLFDTISIDVFRSLSADHHYKLMSAGLKAELLEKWGTFL